MYTILRRNARDIRSVGSKRFGMEVLLRGVYVHGDLFYLHVLMRNRSKVAFDIDYIRFKVCDRKTLRPPDPKPPGRRSSRQDAVRRRF